jgi:hypothetical protein
MHNLAGIYLDQGRMDEAEALYLYVLSIWERVLDGEHPDTLGIMHNLGFFY